MPRLLYRLGRFGARRRWRVLAVWPLAVAAVAALAVLLGGSFVSAFTVPGSAAQSALDRMEAQFPGSGMPSATVVFRAPAGHRLDEPGLRGSLTATLAAAAGVPGVAAVSDPFRTRGVSADGRTAAADVRFSAASDDKVDAATLEALQATGSIARADGTTVVFGGEPYRPAPALAHPAEAAGLLVAVVVLVITFGSLLAAGLPLLTALIGVGLTMAGILAAAARFGISDNAPALAIMLALAVGIDYSLFIVSRHRSQLADGMPVEESIATALSTAGNAVVLAGGTVVIALCGLLVADVPLLTAMGLTAAGGVAVDVLLALTLLPALLAVAGERLTPRPRAERWPRRRPGPRPGGSLAVRWVGGVTRHPVAAILAVTFGLSAVALPVAGLQLALPDDGVMMPGAQTRQAYDLIAEGFGPGANGPLVLLVENQDAAALRTQSDAVVAQVRGVSAVAAAGPVDVAPDSTAARIKVIPRTGPRDAATGDLVVRLNDLAAATAARYGGRVSVTGQTAVSRDVSSTLAGSLLPFGLAVIGLSLLLLLVAFRSVAVPVKATAGFLLSLLAALGVTVAVFQWGWLAAPLGVPRVGPVASFTPIIVMAVLFGLGMDYEVFLVSGMREDFVRTGDAHGAVVRGVRHSARVVVAAALIMVSVFVGFVLTHDRNIMPIALALTVGILFDAFAVRMTLVPAVLYLLGARAWWLPRWLERRLPVLDVEGAPGADGSPAVRAGSRDRAPV